MSRGLRNCNPGNIRCSRVFYKGEIQPSADAHFKQFEAMEWGYRAIFILLDYYRRHYGLHTLRGMISRYAPPSENYTDIYLRALCDFTGLEADEPLDTRSRRVMVPVVSAISRIENGVAAHPLQVERGFDLTGWDDSQTAK